MKLWGGLWRRPAGTPQAEPPEMTQKGHILVVEDNAGVLGAAKEFLTLLGYRVSTATSVAEARDQARVSPDLDLVITDYHLQAGETGRDVIVAVREIFGPTFKVVVMTGDTSTAVHSFDSDRNLCWLRKPFQSAQLAAVLENFLGRERVR